MIYFYIKNDELNTLLYEKDMLNQQLLSIQKAMAGEQDKNLITLSGKTKDAIMLNPNDILYIESSGNYVTIYFLEDEKVSRRVIRTTIQQMEDVLKAYPSIIRCHRAFIVNIAYTEKRSTYQQGFLLMLKPVDKKVPVSRTYKKNFLPSGKN
jgi:DNA-binding LytR/AlgR family response regulator